MVPAASTEFCLHSEHKNSVSQSEEWISIGLRIIGSTCEFLYTSCTIKVCTTDNKDILKSAIHNIGLVVAIFNTYLQNE
jgi:hypothetical protein